MDVTAKMLRNNALISVIGKKPLSSFYNENLYDVGMLSLQITSADKQIEEATDNAVSLVTDNSHFLRYVVGIMERELVNSKPSLLPYVLENYNLSLYSKKSNSVKVMLNVQMTDSPLLNLLKFKNTTKGMHWIC